MEQKGLCLVISGVCESYANRMSDYDIARKITSAYGYKPVIDELRRKYIPGKHVDIWYLSNFIFRHLTNCDAVLIMDSAFSPSSLESIYTKHTKDIIHICEVSGIKVLYEADYHE